MSNKNIANFLYEVGMLSKTPRSGLHFLGTGDQSVSEHAFRVVYVGYTLASLEENVDMLKVLKMCLLHDVAEARTSDLNYVHQQYVTSQEDKAIADLTEGLPFGEDVQEVIHEYEKRESRESIIAKDADNVEWVLTLKEQYDIGNTRAKPWITAAVKRLKTEGAKKLVQDILGVESDDWWFGDKDNDWWVTRNKE